jgi:hypothetical protein
MAVSNVINTKRVAMETQQCFICIVALNMPLPTIKEACRSPSKVPDIFVQF